MNLFRKLFRRKPKSTWPPPPNPELEHKADLAVQEVRNWLHEQLSNSEIWWHGAIHIDPRSIAVWVKTDTDLERDTLIKNGLRERVHQAFEGAGYPAEAICHVGVACESDETVKRDWQGSWRHRIQ